MLIYDPNKPISKHFKMYEIGKSDTAIRQVIDNTPPPLVLTAAEALANKVLEPIRTHFGIPFSPTSWYRGEELERFINKVAYRQWCDRQGFKPGNASWKRYFALKSHPKGEAVDFEIPGISNDVLFNWIDKNVPEYDQLIREFAKPGDPSSGWVHVSYSLNNKNRRMKFHIG